MAGTTPGANEAWKTRRSRYGARGRPNEKRASPGTRTPRAPRRRRATRPLDISRNTSKNTEATMKRQRTTGSTQQAPRIPTTQATKRQGIRRKMEQILRDDKTLARLKTQLQHAREHVRDEQKVLDAAERAESRAEVLNDLISELRASRAVHRAEKRVRIAEQAVRKVELAITERETAIRASFNRQSH